jgi:hypothetical protein
MVTDYPLAKSSVTGDWINAFIYVDENARNIQVANGRAEYTVRRLEQGARHAFTVLTSNNFADTGGGGSVSSEFSWPSNPRWEFHTVADRGGAAAPAPIDWASLYPNCDAVRAHYPGGVKQGSPIYRPALDRDGNGIACEPASTDRGGAAAPAPIDWASLYPNCDAVRAHYPGGVKQGSPIYRPALDRDGNGIACEPASTDRGGAAAPAPIDWASLYPNCDAVRAHYPGGVKQGSPIYRPALDRDGDGIACEPASTVPSGNYLPIQDIGTFSGTGDDANIVIRLDAGLYRVTSTHSGDGHFAILAKNVATDDRELLANGLGKVREVETFRVGDGFLQNPPGEYLLAITAEGDWTLQVELIGAN